MPNQTSPDSVPQHIAVIMDGKRRFGGANATDLTGRIAVPDVR